MVPLTCTLLHLILHNFKQFQVEEVPKEDYGRFYSGDSYIVLNVKKFDDELIFDAYFWIGASSTQDEYCTAAYKTVELDTFLDDMAIQHREVEGFESTGFKTCFRTFE
ncbi:unnamed protein product [Protopolystoma xenopodis]|uniref:Gelsolin-like domain-containing protein n=1 Tax=Protopolystoma xenopodis TaxID=117903 RepID=A0A448WKW9_9PLAT|nr:unnamed protein product [Protopolystoma xenopodis]